MLILGNDILLIDVAIVRSVAPNYCSHCYIHHVTASISMTN